MSNLTKLEKNLLSVMLSSFLATQRDVHYILEGLKVKDRIFSAAKDGFCSGFYTHFEKNVTLANIEDVPPEFSLQAKCELLTTGEMGFLVFCDSATKSLIVLEGFLYGDERISVEELIKNEHTFSVYMPLGM